MTTQYENAYVISVMADDHPGIIAGVSGAVAELNGNIDACSQTVLDDYFTLIIIASFPQPQTPETIATTIRGPESKKTGFQVMVRPFVPTNKPRKADSGRFVITAFGKDKSGVVRRFSQYLAGKDVNILDLFGDRTGDEFVLISEVEIPDGQDIGMLQADLEHMGREEGFTIRLQHENIFVATNQLRMTRG